MTRTISPLVKRDPLAPLVWLIVPLPLWWVLGLANLGWFVAAVPMVIYLVRRGRAAVPAGFGWWLLFCLWVVLSVVMLGVNPAGTIPEPVSERMLPVAFRFAEYGSATVTMLWAYAVVLDGVPARRVVRLLGILLAWTVLGGLVGTLAPSVELTSPVELLLPDSIASNSYVQALVHPAAAQVQDVLGTGDARPSAPFAYTNTWGNALALLLPWGIVAALMARGRARFGWIALLAVAVVPAIGSLNRGLWVALVIAGVITVAYLLAVGYVSIGLSAIAVATVAVVLLMVSPLGAMLTDRNSGEAPSDDIRSFSIDRAVEVAVDSPVLGYGGTREQRGSSSSIGVGESASCPDCGGLALGTNGQLWFALVGQGFVGTFFYLGFHVVLLVRFLRDRSSIAVAGALTTVLAMWFTLVYDRTGPTGSLELLILGFVAAYVALRQRQRLVEPPAPLRGVVG